MESSVNSRSRLLTAGGVLSILAGIFQIIGGLLLAGIIAPSLPFFDFFLDLQVETLCMLLLLLSLPLGYLGGLSGMDLWAPQYQSC